MEEISQLIIVRKDLNMSAGKLAAQVAHAAMAFLTSPLRKNAQHKDCGYRSYIDFNADVFDNWINGSFTKIVCEAKNRYQLMKVIDVATELGLKEGHDYFLIKDNCLTELDPEEVDEKGVHRTLTCIGFRPLPKDVCRTLSKKYQLYK